LVAVAAFAALGAAASPGVALAQPGDPGGENEASAAPAAVPAPVAPVTSSVIKDPKLAKKWLATAQQLRQKAAVLAAQNRPDDARAQLESSITAYQRAIEASDDASLYVEVAAVDEKLGRIAAAVTHLRRVIAAAAGVRPEIVKKATARLEVLSTQVGLVTLIVAPAGASITLGGTGIGTSPLAEPLALMPGTYMLSFQAAGFQPKEAAIKVDAGSEAEHAIALDPVTVIVAPVGPARPDEPLLDDTPPALPLWIGAGVTGAGAVGATVFGLLAVRRHATFTRASTSAPDRDAARTSGRRLALASDIALGTAVVAAGYTVYWYFARYRRPPRVPRAQEDRHSAPVDAKLDVVPWVQPQSGGVTIAGRF
jgi:hypothetical protein